jgi:hypothetical protein
VMALLPVAPSTTWLLVRMYPELSITKPEPVALPDAFSVEIETTEGRTRWAIPATESGARSMLLETATRLILCPRSVPLVVKSPTALPTNPATTANATADPKGMLVRFGLGAGSDHHGAGALAEFFGSNASISTPRNLKKI